MSILAKDLVADETFELFEYTSGDIVFVHSNTSKGLRSRSTYYEKKAGMGVYLTQVRFALFAFWRLG